MNFLAGIAAALVIASGILAVSSRDARLSLLGLAGVVLLAPLAATPLPSPASLGVRTCASLIGLELAWVAMRDGRPVARGSSLGWQAQAVAAIAAAVVGWGSAAGAGDVLGRTEVSPEAFAAALALAILAFVPLVAVRDGFRLGIGTVLLIVASALAWAGLAGASGGVDQIVSAALILGALGSVAVLVRAAAPAS